MLQVPPDLGHYLWKIPDRRSMVVLPFLDPRLYLRRIWILFRQCDSPVADIRIVCHYHAFHLRRKITYYHYQQNRKESIRSPHAGYADFLPYSRYSHFLHSHWVTFLIWFPIIIIGIAGAAHQSWSANIYL